MPSTKKVRPIFSPNYYFQQKPGFFSHTEKKKVGSIQMVIFEERNGGSVVLVLFFIPQTSNSLVWFNIWHESSLEEYVEYIDELCWERFFSPKGRKYLTDNSLNFSLSLFLTFTVSHTSLSLSSLSFLSFSHLQLHTCLPLSFPLSQTLTNTHPLTRTFTSHRLQSFQPLIFRHSDITKIKPFIFFLGWH